MQHLWHGGGSKSLFQDSFPDSHLIFRDQHVHLTTLQNQTQRKKFKNKHRIKKFISTGNSSTNPPENSSLKDEL
jgi:hypothetical protein